MSRKNIPARGAPYVVRTYVLYTLFTTYSYSSLDSVYVRRDRTYACVIILPDKTFESTSVNEALFNIDSFRYPKR